MVSLIGKPPGDYEKLSGWVWWKPDTVKMRSEGWKLHIGGNPTNAQRILNAVLPVLQSLEAAHKFLPSTGSFDAQTKEQTGKWFTVYPNSVLHAFVTVYGIDEALDRINISEKDVTPVASDEHVGKTAVYTRYGGYDDRKVRNSEGRLVSDSVGYKPKWILNPWNRYANCAYSSTSGGIERGWETPFPRYDFRGRSR